MTFMTWACLRYVQELTTILGPRNRTQGSCVLVVAFSKYCEYQCTTMSKLENISHWDMGITRDTETRGQTWRGGENTG